MVPLFGPVPGGAELIVIFLILVLLFGIPLALVGSGFVLYRRTKSGGVTEDDVEALRHEIERLREQIRELEDDDR